MCAGWVPIGRTVVTIRVVVTGFVAMYGGVVYTPFTAENILSKKERTRKLILSVSGEREREIARGREKVTL